MEIILKDQDIEVNIKTIEVEATEVLRILTQAMLGYGFHWESVQDAIIGLASEQKIEGNDTHS